jgi:DNA-binding transcriptional MerR regulator
MAYTVKQLADLAGVSVRTLHYYDEVGLLKPSAVKGNGYRQYEEPELLRLQQILFFRELDFSVEDIKRTLSSPNFDMRRALQEQRTLIELKKKRLADLIKTIDKTMKKINNEISMDDHELYDAFSDEEQKHYAEEAKQRWGHTEAYKQSMERVGNMTKADMKRLKEDGKRFMETFASHMDEGATGPVIQKMIDQHYNSLRTFYEPNLELYRGLANMYVDDPRFAAYYEKFRPGLAAFMREAMLFYVNAKQKKI